MFQNHICYACYNLRTTATIFTSVSRNTRTTETIDQVGATSTVLARIWTAFVDIYNRKIPPENMTVHIFFIVPTLIYLLRFKVRV